MPDFSLLYKAVATPKDVTPNQQEAILKWIQTIRKPETDTTHKK